ncbi:uncharacterized protein HKW66_Vig0044520 [Vigna angularis]|uniref:Uncharacterized protein n=1 Tax=Phaseolus angularis TaxID=3914 RepID=A0A8T0KZ15_PHAAN|nr:uncharacterized protein HKW66_Vig0044520 [Vigna angularis]
MTVDDGKNGYEGESGKDEGRSERHRRRTRSGDVAQPIFSVNADKRLLHLCSVTLLFSISVIAKEDNFWSK